MAMVNLLPWRDMQRDEIKKKFIRSLVFTVVFVFFVGVLLFFYYRSDVSHAESRNQYLQQQIKVVEPQIKKIDEMKTRYDEMLKKIKAVEVLQAKRAYTVHLLESFVEVMPKGLYLSSIKKNDTDVILTGLSVSNNEVNTLLANIVASKWFQKPKLVNIDIAKNNAEYKRQFVVSMTLIPQEEVLKKMEQNK
tara:strand:+ start:68553 stop:69128 length:576 start_codon:yes stop_codon:yes gene_type:complete